MSGCYSSIHEYDGVFTYVVGFPGFIDEPRSTAFEFVVHGKSQESCEAQMRVLFKRRNGESFR